MAKLLQAKNQKNRELLEELQRYQNGLEAQRSFGTHKDTPEMQSLKEKVQILCEAIANCEEKATDSEEVKDAFMQTYNADLTYLDKKGTGFKVGMGATRREAANNLKELAERTFGQEMNYERVIWDSLHGYKDSALERLTDRVEEKKKNNDRSTEDLIDNVASLVAVEDLESHYRKEMNKYIGNPEAIRNDSVGQYFAKTNQHRENKDMIDSLKDLRLKDVENFVKGANTAERFKGMYDIHMLEINSKNNDVEVISTDEFEKDPKMDYIFDEKFDEKTTEEQIDEIGNFDINAFAKKHIDKFGDIDKAIERSKGIQSNEKTEEIRRRDKLKNKSIGKSMGG